MLVHCEILREFFFPFAFWLFNVSDNYYRILKAFGIIEWKNFSVSKCFEMKKILNFFIFILFIFLLSSYYVGLEQFLRIQKNFIEKFLVSCECYHKNWHRTGGAMLLFVFEAFLLIGRKFKDQIQKKSLIFRIQNGEWIYLFPPVKYSSIVFSMKYEVNSV